MKSRHEFMISGLAISAGLLSCCRSNILKDNEKHSKQPDIKSMSYCCLNCNDKCQIFKATVENDIKVKQTVAANWTKEYGEEFTVDDVFCYGCKREGKSQNKSLLKCTVRKCAKAKQIESCSLCNDLTNCEKDLWKNWPNVKVRALEIQNMING
jgi:hypothetical protein